MSEPIVEVSGGKIMGMLGENWHGKRIYKFLGVPYAKPPTGELRFKAPEPVEPWEGIKDATKDGEVNFQRDIMQGANKIIGSEDCLVLNVFTQHIQTVENSKPVMVFIHGGAFTMGYNKSTLYGPELLLTEDIVLVTINYRLGILGFLSLDDDSLDVPGNAGLKDQVLALKWVQENIQQFGGDKTNVTIFGESAGSGSTHFHVLSPASKGLFHKAVLMSGVTLCPWALVSSSGPIIAEALGKKGASDQEVYSILKDMSGEEILLLQEKVPDLMLFGPQRPFSPVIEKENPKAFITKHPSSLITSGEYNHVPIFIGYTSHEGILLDFFKKIVPNVHDMYSYPLALPWFMHTTEEQSKKAADLISNYYSKIKSPENKQMLMMDSIMLAEIVAAIKMHCKTSKHPLYVYRVSADCKRNWVKQTEGLQEFEGTCHADELGFIFSVENLPKIEPNSFENFIVQRCIKLWTNFARTGNPTPNTDLGVKLPPVKGGDNITLLDIGKELTVLQDLPERERIELWKSIFSLSEKTADYL